MLLSLLKQTLWLRVWGVWGVEVAFSMGVRPDSSFATALAADACSSAS